MIHRKSASGDWVIAGESARRGGRMHLLSPFLQPRSTAAAWLLRAYRADLGEYCNRYTQYRAIAVRHRDRVSAPHLVWKKNRTIMLVLGLDGSRRAEGRSSGTMSIDY